MDCVFCKIAAGEIPSVAVYQDQLAYAFGDISPKAPVHVLIIPREHIACSPRRARTTRSARTSWVSRGTVARQKVLAKGYRVVVNTGEEGGQTVEHLHLHLMGGFCRMTWPVDGKKQEQGTKKTRRTERTTFEETKGTPGWRALFFCPHSIAEHRPLRNFLFFFRAP